MKTKIKVLITCEHGGAEIPQKFGKLFRNHRSLLRTHRGSDMGALGIAHFFAKSLKAPLFFSKTSRLLVDLNRSVGHKDLHSEITRLLPKDIRQQILQQHWHPYRTKIDTLVRDWARSKNSVVHISSHSFTPKLHGKIRQADVAFLYDPSRQFESRLAKKWALELRKIRPDLRVRRNYPYQGKADGVMKTLRKKWNVSTYVGIELEVNQHLLVSKNQFSKTLAADLHRAFMAALA